MFALLWFLPFFALFRLARTRPSLKEYPPLPGALVSIIIPARNEAETISTVIRSVLATTYPSFELLVVDDRSTDSTAEIVRREAATDPRVRLVEGEELPGGWYGKPWACLQGYRAATGDLLLFTDADTRHEPELLGRAVSALQITKSDLVTVAPHQACLTFWERTVMPHVWVLLGFRFHPSIVTRAKRARDVIANGQFILTRRTSYDKVGTHEVVRGDVAEDLGIAQAYHRAGKRIWFGFAGEYMETRMYRNLTHLIEGWSKNIYLGGRASFPGQPWLQALVPYALGGAMLYWLLPLLLWGIGALGVLPPELTSQAAWASGFSLLFWVLILLGMKIPIWYAPFYPVGAAMTLYIVVRSTVRGNRRVEWKGRTYGETVNPSKGAGAARR